MAQPILQCSLDWTPYNNAAHKLSMAAPFYIPNTQVLVDPRKVDLHFVSNEYLEKIYITVVKEGDSYGFINDVLVDLTTGIKVVDYSQQPPASLSVTLNSVNHFKKGDGNYRVGIYAQNAEGYWNYEYFFVAFRDMPLYTRDEEAFMVPVKTELEEQ